MLQTVMDPATGLLALPLHARVTGRRHQIDWRQLLPKISYIHQLDNFQHINEKLS